MSFDMMLILWHSKEDLNFCDSGKKGPLKNEKLNRSLISTAEEALLGSRIGLCPTCPQRAS